ncbi:MAG: CAP domain-containing protein [Desulfitobacteriaceae bacterium]
MHKLTKISAGLQTFILACSIALPTQAAVQIGAPKVSQSSSVVTIHMNQPTYDTVLQTPGLVSTTVTPPTQTPNQNPVSPNNFPSINTTNTTTSSVVSLKGLLNNCNTAPATSSPSPTSTTPPVAPGPLTIPTSLTFDEQSMVNMVNQARIDAGLKPLIVDYRLVAVARAKGQDMKDNKYFAHISPTFGYSSSLMINLGLKVSYTSENLASNNSVSGAMANFMLSIGHRINILDPNVTHIGVGIVYSSVFGNLYVQEFFKE